MIPHLYKAAMEGQVQILNEYKNQFDVELTENNNTVLHVAAQFGQLSCVESILQECRHSLLHRRNCKNETPPHIAAREGNLGVVEKLIKRAKEVESEGQTTKELLRAMNFDKDTALHMAVKNEHLEIVRILTREDPEFSYPANKAEETLLYLAVERGSFEMVVVILDNCLSPLCSGPNGSTALHHAALLAPGIIASKIIQWKPELIDKSDVHGWTPLHYAARSGNVKLVKKILQTNYLLAHIRTEDNDGGKTALHIAAAAVGEVPVMKEILSACPECWETVDCLGQNILHIGVDMENKRVLEFILKMSWSSQLINQKDNEGNTPQHLVAALEIQPKGWDFLRKYLGYYDTFNNKSMSPEEVLWFKDYLPYGRILSGRNVVRNDRDSLAIWKSARTKRLEERKKKVQQHPDSKRLQATSEMAQTHVIVATLIATLTFTASFTIPGGYDSNPGSQQGMAVLVRKAAFKAFVIANTIAALCSTTSVFLYVTASASIHEYRRTVRHESALWLILIAMVAMMVAFITGNYSTLSHSLGVPIAVLGGISFLIYYQELDNMFVIRRRCVLLGRKSWAYLVRKLRERERISNSTYWWYASLVLLSSHVLCPCILKLMAE